MIAPLGTLVFLATVWLLVVLGASVLEESGVKIAAALKGKTLQPSLRTPTVRLRARPRMVRAMRASARWRAAA